MKDERKVEFYKRLGANLKKKRRAAGISQAKLATQIEQTQSAMSLYESGERCVGLEELLDICGALNTPLSDIIPDLDAGTYPKTIKTWEAAEELNRLKPIEQKAAFAYIQFLAGANAASAPFRSGAA